MGVLGTAAGKLKSQSRRLQRSVKHKRRPAPSTKTCAWTSPAPDTWTWLHALHLHGHGTAWAWSGPCQKETRTGAAVVPCIDWLGALVALLRCFRECLFAPLCARSVDSIGAPSACCARPVRRCEHPRAHPLLALASAPRLASSLQTPTLTGGTCIAADIDNCSESKPVRPISTASSMR